MGNSHGIGLYSVCLLTEAVPWTVLASSGENAIATLPQGVRHLLVDCFDGESWLLWSRRAPRDRADAAERAFMEIT